jgi:hypothetical protein
MGEGCRGGSEMEVSDIQLPLCGGVKSRRGNKRPHSEIFTDSTEVGAGGASGGREQEGPVQEHGLLGSRLSFPPNIEGEYEGSIIALLSGRSASVRSTCVG